MTDLPADAMDRIIELLRDNRLLDAVKIYKEETGASLMEAKNKVEAFRDRLALGEPLEIDPSKSDLPPATLYRVVQQLRDDRLLAAIKIYKDEMGTSLLTAKGEVESLREQLRRGELTEPQGDFAVEPDAPYLPPNAMNQIVLALQNQRLIDAVKTYREVMHCSLAEAKKEVEHIRDQLERGEFDGGFEDDDNHPLDLGEARASDDVQYTPPAVDKSSGCFGVVLLFIATAAAVAMVMNT